MSGVRLCKIEMLFTYARCTSYSLGYSRGMQGDICEIYGITGEEIESHISSVPPMQWSTYSVECMVFNNEPFIGAKEHTSERFTVF